MLGKRLPGPNRSMAFAGSGSMGAAGRCGRSRPSPTGVRIPVARSASRTLHPLGLLRRRTCCDGNGTPPDLARAARIAQLFLIDTPLVVNAAFLDKEVRLAERALETAPQLRSYLAGAPATVAAFGEALSAYQPKAYSGKADLWPIGRKPSECGTCRGMAQIPSTRNGAPPSLRRRIRTSHWMEWPPSAGISVSSFARRPSAPGRVRRRRRRSAEQGPDLRPTCRAIPSFSA